MKVPVNHLPCMTLVEFCEKFGRKIVVKETWPGSYQAEFKPPLFSSQFATVTYFGTVHLSQFHASAKSARAAAEALAEKISGPHIYTEPDGGKDLGQFNIVAYGKIDLVDE